jgi:lysophospholipid acyltransferase (LPLAT)-like uncharacterized protein
MFRSFLRRPGAQAVLCWLIVRYIQLVWKTGRWTFTGDDAPRALIDAGKPLIFTFWHGRLLMIPYALGGERRDASVLISTHRDGQVISRVVHYFDIATIAGSTSRGGADAFRKAIKFLRRGGPLGITPDGPRGPRMRASDGVIAIARRTGAPILPVSYSTSWRIVLGSWDRFVLPLPFARGAFVWGAPIHVAKDADRETARHALEHALNATAEQADALVGQPAIAPAAAAMER